MRWDFFLLSCALLFVGCRSAPEDDPVVPPGARPWPAISTADRNLLDGLVRRFAQARALDLEATVERDGEMGVVQAHVLRPLRGSVQETRGETFTERLGDGKAIYFLDHDRQTFRRTDETSWRAALPPLYLCGVWADADVREGIQDIKVEEDAGRTRIALAFPDRIESFAIDERQRVTSARIDWRKGGWVRYEFSRFELTDRPDPSRYRSAVPANYRPVVGK